MGTTNPESTFQLHLQNTDIPVRRAISSLRAAAEVEAESIITESPGGGGQEQREM